MPGPYGPGSSNGLLPTPGQLWPTYATYNGGYQPQQLTQPPTVPTNGLLPAGPVSAPSDAIPDYSDLGVLISDGNPDTDTGTPTGIGAVDVGIGTPSGQPGTGGVMGMAKGVASALGFMTNPVTAVLGMAARKAASSAGIGGGSGSPAGVGPSGVSAVSPGSAEAEAQEAGLGTNATGQNTTGAGSSTSPANTAATGAEAAAQDAGVATNDTGQATGGGDGGGGGGGRFICTELVRQGKMSESLLAIDQRHSKTLHPHVMAGYAVWAEGYARAMRTSPGLTAFTRPIALARAEAVAYSAGYRIDRHYGGMVVRLIGEPVCFVIGWIKGMFNAHA